MEELENLIKTSYGIEDSIFAGHGLDRERALRAIVLANELGVGFENFLDMHKRYLKEKGLPEEHINNQISRVKTIDFYFRND